MLLTCVSCLRELNLTDLLSMRRTRPSYLPSFLPTLVFVPAYPSVTSQQNRDLPGGWECVRARGRRRDGTGHFADTGKCAGFHSCMPGAPDETARLLLFATAHRLVLGFNTRFRVRPAAPRGTCSAGGSGNSTGGRLAGFSSLYYLSTYMASHI